MRLTAECCCGATLVIDNGGAGDVGADHRLDKLFTAWNDKHSGKCEPPETPLPFQCLIHDTCDSAQCRAQHMCIGAQQNPELIRR